MHKRDVSSARYSHRPILLKESSDASEKITTPMFVIKYSTKAFPKAENYQHCSLQEYTVYF